MTGELEHVWWSGGIAGLEPTGPAVAHLVAPLGAMDGAARCTYACALLATAVGQMRELPRGLVETLWALYTHRGSSSTTVPGPDQRPIRDSETVRYILAAWRPGTTQAHRVASCFEAIGVVSRLLVHGNGLELWCVLREDLFERLDARDAAPRALVGEA